MLLIERYLLKQLMWPTLFATIALSMIALLSQTLGALDIIVNQGQGPLVLLEVSFLAMPQLLVIILPIAIFVAALITLNRLHTEQEIVVCLASGASLWRVSAPALRLAAAATVLCLFINLWVTPLAERTLRAEMYRVRTDLASSLVRVGAFTEPSPGLTVYAQSIDPSGAFRNMFVIQERADGSDVTFFASKGRISKRGGAPGLVMRDGSEEQYAKTGVLEYLKFDEYILDLAKFMKPDELIRYKASDRYLHELVFPDLTQAWERHERKALLAEANARLAAPLYNLSFMAMALAAVVGGAFSRFGYARRIAVVSAAAAAVRILGFAAQAFSEAAPILNLLQYALPAAAFGWALQALLRPRLGARLRPAARGAAA